MDHNLYVLSRFSKIYILEKNLEIIIRLNISPVIGRLETN